MRMIAIVMLAAGILALVYGGFSYTKQTHEAKLGPLEFSLSENRRVNVPIWAGSHSQSWAEGSCSAGRSKGGRRRRLSRMSRRRRRHERWSDNREPDR